MSTVRLRGDERREQIVTAAEHVFGRQGYQATRMTDIAEAADVAIGLLYKHFPSKDFLFNAVVERQGEALVERITSALADAGPDPDLVGTAMKAWFSMLDTPEFQTVDPGGHNGYLALRERFRTIVADALRVVCPEATEARLQIAAAAVVGASEAAGETWREFKAVPMEEAIDLTTTFVVGGLTALV